MDGPLYKWIKDSNLEWSLAEARPKAVKKNFRNQSQCGRTASRDPHPTPTKKTEGCAGENKDKQGEHFFNLTLQFFLAPPGALIAIRTFKWSTRWARFQIQTPHPTPVRDKFETTFGQLSDALGQLWDTTLGQLCANFGATWRRLWDNFGANLIQLWDNLERTLGPRYR